MSLNHQREESQSATTLPWGLMMIHCKIRPIKHPPPNSVVLRELDKIIGSLDSWNPKQKRSQRSSGHGVMEQHISLED